MSQRTTPRLPRRLLRELEGEDWQVVPGSRHFRLLIDGRQVLVFGHDAFSSCDVRSTLNAVGHVRRFIRARDREVAA